MAKTAAASVALLLAAFAAGCGDEGETSSDDIKRDASFVLRADLKPGTSGSQAFELVESWADLDGVGGTHGDAGKHVWIYGAADATVIEMNEVLATVESNKRVSTTRQLR